MKKVFLFLLSACTTTLAMAQDIDKLINAGEVERIEKVLAADDMQGRKVFTPSIDRAGDFIAAEFKKSGLQFFPGLTTYKQSFVMYKTKTVSIKATVYGQPLDSKNVVVVSTQKQISFNEQQTNVDKEVIHSDANFSAEIGKYMNPDQNYVVFVDSSFRKNFARLYRYRKDGESLKLNFSTVFVLCDNPNPSNYQFDITNEVTEQKLTNIVGILPGKSKKDEYVVFSGHYDHLGIGKPNEAGDSIYNGANDDAAGTTAVMMLANYFSKTKNNERTLIFVAFTAEEIGEYGSSYFSKQVDAEKVKAMFNIEMIGTESKWGTNSAYITGFDKTDMGTILQHNLTGSKFHFEPDPYTDQNLFYRSDNASLAKLGVPAHTISTSKMDSEKFYHTQGDDISTLDMNNMAEIIKAIAISSKTIISGADTPTRVNNSNDGIRSTKP